MLFFVRDINAQSTCVTFETKCEKLPVNSANLNIFAYMQISKNHRKGVNIAIMFDNKCQISILHTVASHFARICGQVLIYAADVNGLSPTRQRNWREFDYLPLRNNLNYESEMFY